MDINKFFAALIEAGAFISAFAGIAAGLIMTRVTKKFGTGILASGFRIIAIGVILIAFGIIFDAIQLYISNYDTTFTVVFLSIKEALFIIGTYIIVIGSKKTGDKLETLTK